MEVIEANIEHLRKIENNFKKAPNRSYSKPFLNQKLDRVRELRNIIVDDLATLEDVLSQKYVDSKYVEVRTVTSRIFHFIELRIGSARNTNYTFKTLARLAIICRKLRKDPIQSNTMAEQFDIKTATAIVQTYDGCSANLNTFIDGANLLKEFTSRNHMEMAAKFLKTRLTGKARQGLPEDVKTIDDIIADVKARCTETITAQNIMAKLKASSQKNDLEKFCTDVDSLTTQLQNIYVSQKIPTEIAKSMAAKAGIDTLINGIKNTETKIILKAGNYSSVREAIQKVNENTTQEACEKQIFHMVGQKFTNRNRQYFNAQRGNYRGRYVNRNTRFNNNNNHHNNNRQYSGNYGRDQNRYNPESRYRNNDYNRRGGSQRNHPNRNVFYSENGNQPSTQPQVEAETEHGDQIIHPRR